MARQARSEATRRKILDAAVELFSEVGFAATGLGDIIERAELTKGALYYHFDSKQSLASAIIAESAGIVFEKFSTICASSSPAMENVIHSSFALAGIATTDPMVHTATQLARALGEFNDAAAQSYQSALGLVANQLAEASADGDLRAGLSPDAVAETLLSAYLGAELITGPRGNATDLISRLTRIWGIMLPAIAAEDALPFLTEYLSREALRHSRITLSLD